MIIYYCFISSPLNICFNNKIKYKFVTIVPSIVINLVVPQYIINNVNCKGPYNNSEGDDDRDIVCTSKSSGSAKINPYTWI